MEKLDQAIREALSADDAELFADAGEPSVCELVIDSFRSRQRWLVALVFFWTFALFVGSVFCAVMFFKAEDTRDAVAWGLGVIIGMNAVGLLKSWYWMQLNKNALLREIKRTELQLARLSSRLAAVSQTSRPSHDHNHDAGDDAAM